MIKSYVRIYILIFILVISMATLWIILPDAFMTQNNLQSLGFQLPILALFSLAMSTVVLTGGFDLSIIAVANLTSLVAGYILHSLNSPNISPSNQIFVIILAIVCALVAALICGLINGFIIATLGVHPVLATLGTMTFFNGIVAKTTEGLGIAGFVDKFSYIGNGTILKIPVSIIIILICFLIMGIIFNKTKFGFSLYMIGSNPLASKFSGLNVKAILYKAYITSSIIAAISGIIMSSQFNSVKGGYGSSYLLLSVLVVVFGGISVSGGSGGVAGVLIAACILQVVWNGFNILRLSSYFTITIWGLILISVLIVSHHIDIYNRRRLIKRMTDIK